MLLEGSRGFFWRGGGEVDPLPFSNLVLRVVPSPKIVKTFPGPMRSLIVKENHDGSAVIKTNYNHLFYLFLSAQNNFT